MNHIIALLESNWGFYFLSTYTIKNHGYFTSEDLEIYYKVGKFMSSEKSQDKSPFNEFIPPSFLLYILRDN